MRLVAPSLLSADFANLQADIEMINNSDADWFHLDIMDGIFVPNITFGMPVIKAIKKHAKKPLDVHLMITDPDRYIQGFKDAGTDILTVHYEACNHLHRSIQSIKNLGMKAGVALNPHSPVSLLENIISDVDMILIMSVNPGFGGQKFIQQTYQKLEALNQLKKKYNSQCLVEVDGGVDLNNANLLYNAGVNILVAGNTVFSSSDPVKTIHDLKK